MKTHKTKTLTLITFLCSLTLIAQTKLAIINDPDGFTFVRNGQGKDFSVVDTLYKEDFFYFEFVDSSDWVKISAWKGRQIEGFIHNSRVQIVGNLSLQKQKELITKILNRQRILAISFYNAWKTKDSIAYRKSIRELESYNDTKYDPILDILSKYICKTSDSNILQLFFATLLADKGSANELPSFSIGDCFICNPNFVIQQLAKINDKEEKMLICDHIEWGLINQFNIEEDKKSDNPEFNRLKKLLDKEKKKASP